MSGKYLAHSLATIDKEHVSGSRRQVAMEGILVTLAIFPGRIPQGAAAKGEYYVSGSFQAVPTECRDALASRLQAASAERNKDEKFDFWYGILLLYSIDEIDNFLDTEGLRSEGVTAADPERLAQHLSPFLENRGWLNKTLGRIKRHLNQHETARRLFGNVQELDSITSFQLTDARGNVNMTVEGVSFDHGDRRRKAMHMVDDWLMTVVKTRHGKPAPPNIPVDKDHVFAFLYTAFQLDSEGNRSAGDWQNCLKTVASIYTPDPDVSERQKAVQEEILTTMVEGGYSKAQRDYLKMALPSMIDPELKNIIDAKLEALDGATSEADMEGARGVIAISESGSGFLSKSRDLLSLLREFASIPSAEHRNLSKENLLSNLEVQEPLLAYALRNDLISDHEINSCETLEVLKTAAGNKAQKELDALIRRGSGVAVQKVAQLITAAGASDPSEVHQSILQIKDANLKTFALLLELVVRLNPRFSEESKIFQDITWSNTEFQDFKETLLTTVRSVNTLNLTAEQMQMYANSESELADVAEEQNMRTFLESNPSPVSGLGLLEALQSYVKIESRDSASLPKASKPTDQDQWKEKLVSLIETERPSLAVALMSGFIHTNDFQGQGVSLERLKTTVGIRALIELQAMLSDYKIDIQKVAQLIAIAHGVSTEGGRDTRDILQDIENPDVRTMALQMEIVVRLKPEISQSELFRDVVCGEADVNKLKDFLNNAVKTIRAQTGSQEQLWTDFDLNLADAVQQRSLSTLMQRGIDTSQNLLDALQMYAGLKLTTTRDRFKGLLASMLEKKDLSLGYALRGDLLDEDLVRGCDSIEELGKNVGLRALEKLTAFRSSAIPRNQFQKVLGYSVLTARDPCTQQRALELLMSYEDTLFAQVAFIAAGNSTLPLIGRIFEGIPDQDAFRQDVNSRYQAIRSLPKFGIHDYLGADAKALIEVFQILRIPKGKFEESNAETLVKAYVSMIASDRGGLQHTRISIVRKLKEYGYLRTASALEMGLITSQDSGYYSLSHVEDVAAANAQSRLKSFADEVATKSDMRLTKEEVLHGAKLVCHAIRDAEEFDFTSLDAFRVGSLRTTLQQLAFILLSCPSEAAHWEKRILQGDPSDVSALQLDIASRFEQLPLETNLPESIRQRFLELSGRRGMGITATQVTELEASLKGFHQSSASSKLKLTSSDILDMVKLAVAKEAVKDDSYVRICELLKTQGHDDLLIALNEGLIGADILTGTNKDDADAASKLSNIRNTITYKVKTKLEAYRGLPHMTIEDQEKCDRLIRCLQYDHFNSLESGQKIAFINTVLAILNWPTCSTAVAMLLNNAEISSRVRHWEMTPDHGLLCLSGVPEELEIHVQYMQLMVLGSTMYNKDHRSALDETLRQYIFTEDETRTPSLSDLSRLLQLYVLSSPGVLNKIRQRGVTNITRESLLQSCIECYGSVAKEPETSLQEQLRETLPEYVLDQVRKNETVKKILEATSELELEQLWRSLCPRVPFTAPLYKLDMTQDEITKYLVKPSYSGCFRRINQKRRIGDFDSFKDFTFRTFTEGGVMRHHLDEDGKIQRQYFNIAEDGAHLVKHLLFQRENNKLFSRHFCDLFMNAWGSPPNLMDKSGWAKILMSLVTEENLPNNLKDMIMASEGTTELVSSVTLSREFKAFEVQSGLADLRAALLGTAVLLSSSCYYPINGPGLLISSASAQKALDKLHITASELMNSRERETQTSNGPYAKMLTLLHNTISHTPTEPSSKEHIKSVCEDFRAKVRVMKSSENTFRGFTRDYRDQTNKKVSPMAFWEGIMEEIHKGEQPCPTASVSVSDLIQVLHWFPPTSKQDPLWRLRQVAYEVVVKAADRDGNLNEDFLREVAFDCHMRSQSVEKGLKRKEEVLKMIKEGKRIDCTVLKTPEGEACWTNKLWVLLERAIQNTKVLDQQGESDARMTLSQPSVIQTDGIFRSTGTLIIDYGRISRAPSVRRPQRALRRTPAQDQ